MRSEYKDFVRKYGPPLVALIENELMLAALISVVQFEVEAQKGNALQCLLSNRTHEAVVSAAKADAQIEFLAAIERVAREYRKIGNPDGPEK